MAWIAGVDGFKSRWCVVLQNTDDEELRVRIVPTFAGLLSLPEAPQVVAVDIPIGLPDYAAPGGRACEREARRIVGSRASSVFSAVGRRALEQGSRDEADQASRAAGGLGVGAQAWGLAVKLREADAAMSPECQRVVHEVHPEVCFWAMNDRVPMPFGKKTAEGERARQAALIRAGFPESVVAGTATHLRVGRDDFLDACAAAWTVRRVATGAARRFPASPEALAGRPVRPSGQGRGARNVIIDALNERGPGRPSESFCCAAKQHHPQIITFGWRGFSHLRPAVIGVLELPTTAEHS